MSELSKELFNKYYLFSEPSATEGVARLFDFAGSLQIYNAHKTEAEADACELYHDWRAVGTDIMKAVESYRVYDR